MQKEWLSIHDVKQFEPSCVPMSMQDYIAVTLEEFGSSTFIYHKIQQPPFRYAQVKWKLMFMHKQYTDIYRIFIHNCSKMEAIQASFNLWMDKQAIISMPWDPVSKLLRPATTWMSSMHSYKWRKSDLKGYVLEASILKTFWNRWKYRDWGLTSH